MNKINLTTLGACCLSISVPVLATESEQTIVTATRTKQTVNSSLAPVTVITADEIALYQSKDMFDLLGRAPGVDISRTGGKGSNTSVYLRGTNSNQTLVMIDGQRIGSATLGAAALQNISPSQIDRVEIVRGPRSSLYGADAIGGVIHVFTNKASEDGASLAIKAGAGSDNTTEGSIDLRGRLEKTQLGINLSHLDTQGIDATTDTSFENGDDDAHRNTGISFNIDHEFSERFSLGANYLKNEGETEFDNSFCSDPVFTPIACRPYVEFELEVWGINGDIKSNRLVGYLGKLWRVFRRAG